MKNDKKIKRVGSFVLNCNDSHIREVSVSSLAKMFDIDRSLLSREFKSRNNLTLHRFILIEKLFRSAIMLRRYPGLAVREIAERLGFLSPDHFTRVFKVHFGITPRKYKEYKKEELKN